MPTRYFPVFKPSGHCTNFFVDALYTSALLDPCRRLTPQYANFSQWPKSESLQQGRLSENAAVAKAIKCSLIGLFTIIFSNIMLQVPIYNPISRPISLTKIVIATQNAQQMPKALNAIVISCSEHHHIDMPIVVINAQAQCKMSQTRVDTYSR